MPITNIKTPGVYVEEISLFPPSVAQVATAIPVFAGYTQKAEDSEGKALTGPVRIKSLLEYTLYFGGGYQPESYTIVADAATQSLTDVSVDKNFYLYTSLRLFFDNGGGPCYILSVGSYSDEVDASTMGNAIDGLTKYDEPTLIVFPDAVALVDGDGNPDFAALAGLQQKALSLCAKMQDRFVIFDLMQGNEPEGLSAQPVQQFRNNIGINFLNYGAAYYPWIISNYNINVDFRQLSFVDETDTPIADLSPFSNGNTELLLVAALQNQITETGFIADLELMTEAELLSEGVTVIELRFAQLEADVRDTPSFKSKFTDYMNLLASLAQRFPVAEDNLPPAVPLMQEVSRLKSSVALLTSLKALIKIEKNAGTFLNTLSARDEATVQALYEPLDGGWLGSGPDDNYAGITPDADFAQSREATLGIIQQLKSEVMPGLMAAYRSLYDTALFFESQAAQKLFSQHAFFRNVNERLTGLMRTVPASGAIAGVYVMVDSSRGVWKAPANVSLRSVIGPALKLDNSDQDGLNVHDTGKSVNVIRAFTGKGTLIWGARTLSGNDNEWRYIPVRRFFIMVEESVKKATEPFVFEPNDANTWLRVRVMIENFLTLQWRAGALQGAKPEQAFFVHVGLGETMSEVDILEGRMIIEIGMAAVRPAEFIVLRFSHKMME